MLKWLREPVLHFLLLGAALFVLYGWVRGATPGEGANIAITPGRIEQMTVTFQRTHQRLPSPGELDELIDDAIREEIYYREALALGLDRDDTIVRRRLRQKLEFVTEELAPEPSDAELATFLEQHAELFRTERRYTLRQLYLDPERHADRLAADAERWLLELKDRGGPNADPSGLGDASLLPPHLEKVGAGELSRLFGSEFERAAQTLPVGQWMGPVRSGVGAHLVLLSEREEERASALADVRDEVRRQWGLGWRASKIPLLRGVTPALRRECHAARRKQGRRGAAVKRGLWLSLALLSMLLTMPLRAHEARPAYLQLRQIAPDTYEVLWKLPAQGEGLRLALSVGFADDVSTVSRAPSRFTAGAVVHHWKVRRAGGLDGTAIRINGLESTLTDVLVRLERLGGATRTLRVVPSEPSFVVEAQPNAWEVARTYLALGVEHILLGIDHLLFVLALLLLVKGVRRLVGTITAFTAAHSLTLAAATLGWVHVPSPPVEASIALSIVLLAREMLAAEQGHSGLASRQPWLVAFLFGLLHGLGFAGALSEVGLPGHAIPVALLFFNVGVELGQLAFVAGMLAVLAGMKRVRWLRSSWLLPLPAYAIGTVAAYWTIDRFVGFWG